MGDLYNLFPIHTVPSLQTFIANTTRTYPAEIAKKLIDGMGENCVMRCMTEVGEKLGRHGQKVFDKAFPKEDDVALRKLLLQYVPNLDAIVREVVNDEVATMTKRLDL